MVKFMGDDPFIGASHKTLGGATVVSSNLCWENVEIDGVDADVNQKHKP